MVFALILSFNIVINEIAWMGTEISYNDEWIELYNNTENNIRLDGWVLKADDGTPEINLKGVIPAQDFYLLERTDDETVPGISADLIYKGALENDGEDLKLFDNSGNLIDEANFGQGWPAGDNKTKQTMERATDGAWQTSTERAGTPKAINSIFNNTPNNSFNKRSPAEETIPPIETPKPAKVEPVEIQTILTYPTEIVFNEILPSPEGADAENEWIEIFNQNNFEIDLSDWQIEDKEGKITTFTFPAGTKILPFGFLVFGRKETKITLNNSNDSLTLSNPNKEVLDSVSYEKASLSQSYNKTQSGWAWSPNLTPGKENIVPLPQAEQKPAFSRLQRDTAGKETAALGEKIINLLPEKSNSRSLLPLLIAFTLAICSAIIIFILKKLNRSRTN